MLSFLIILFLLWLFLKLGIGLIKVFAFLIVACILATFFAYLLIPFLALIAVGSLLFKAID